MISLIVGSACASPVLRFCQEQNVLRLLAVYLGQSV